MIEITHNQEVRRWEARFEFNRNDLAKLQTARWRWEPSGKFWWTDDEKKLAILKELIDPSGGKELTDMTHPEVVPVQIPFPEEVVPRDYQKTGISFATQHDKILLADSMGLGKTLQAIGVFNVERPKRTLIICPSSLRYNWQREFEKFGIDVPEIQIPEKTKEDIIKEGIVIVNFEKLAKMHRQLTESWWDLIVVDECHRLKNPKAAMTKSVYGHYNRDPNKRVFPIPKKKLILMSGTPMLNRPIELWPHLKELDPAGLGSDWMYFIQRYCAGHRGGFGWVTNGASNLAELSRKMTKFCIRRTKEQVLPELPGAQHSVVPIEPDKEQRELIVKEQESFDMSEMDLSDDRILIHINKIAEIRQAIAMSKIPLLIDMLVDDTESEKIVVGFHHRAVGEAIYEKLSEKGIKSVLFHGGTTSEKRQEMVDSFQSDESVRVFIGSIGAAGVGITLTAASEMVMMEEDWTPGKMEQYFDRIRRIGQLKSCNYRHLILSGSLDEKMMAKWLKKKAVIGKVF